MSLQQQAVLANCNRWRQVVTHLYRHGLAWYTGYINRLNINNVAAWCSAFSLIFGTVKLPSLFGVAL